MEIKVDNDSIEKIVEQKIALAVSEVLSKNTAYLVEQLVDSALKKPVLDRYGHPEKDRNGRTKTIIQAQTDKMIRVAAEEAAKEWLDEQRPKVKEMVRRKLDAKSKGLISQIADKLAVGLGKDIGVSCWLKHGDD